MLVKPAPGLLVRDPRTKKLVPSDGIELPKDDLDFVRLIRDGDLVEDDAPDAPLSPRDPEPAEDPAEPEEHA